MFSRTLKVEIALRALRDDRLLPGDQRQVRGGGGDLLGVVDRFADPHVEHDLVEPRHFERILVSELLGELGHDLVLIELLQPRDIVLRRGLDRAGRGDLRAALPCVRLALGVLRARGRFRLAAFGGRLFGLAGLGALLGLVALVASSSQPSIRSPERLATRTFRPSSRILKPTRVGLPVLGSSDRQIRQMDRRFLGDDPALGLRRLARMATHEIDAGDDRAALGRHHLANLAPLALVAPGGDDDPVALLDLGGHHSTSGASEMIFTWFLARSSRGTGPKMRVPTGSD